MKSYKKKPTTASGIIIGIWLCVMFVVFPLIFNDFYYDILQTKYITVLISTVTMLSALVVICGFSGGFISVFEDLGRKGFKTWFKEEFSFWDICVIIYMIITLISTALAAPYIMEAILGNRGRFSGLILISVYVIIYFTVSRFFQFNKIYFIIFLAVSIPICIFGYTDYFMLDALHFKVGMNEAQKAIFTSTIGNINTYTAVLAFYIAVSGTLFITTPLKSGKSDKGEGIPTLVFYYIVMFMNFVALAMGSSDNGYLTLAAFFGLMPFVAFRTMEGVRRYLLTLLTYLLGIKIIQVINRVFEGKVLGISGLYEFISNFKYLNFIIIALAIAVIAMFAYAYKKKEEPKDEEQRDDEKLLKALRLLWIGVLILGVSFIIYLGASINGDIESGRERYGALANYFVFNNEWGTYRGYIWRAAVEEYMKFPLLHRLVGSGPDTFGIYIDRFRYSEMTSITGQFFDAAHNEYIQFLFTLGPVATLLYILALAVPSVAALRTRVSNFKNENVLPYLYASALAVICYATQAIVNLNLPIVTPFLWIFLGITVSLLRSKGEV